VSAQPQPPAPDSPEALKQRVEQLQRRLQDWAQLARYREADARLPPPASAEERVVFLGDSITDGWRLDEYFPGKPYINRGISGQTTPQMLVRFRPDVMALKPRVVVILAGTNDIAGNTGPMTLEMIEDNYASLAELARAHGIQVVFASVLPVNDYHRQVTDRRPPDQILKLNEWLKRYSAANGHVYLDYHSRMVDERGMLKAELANDGLHPNAAGYKVMAPLAEAAIAQAQQRTKLPIYVLRTWKLKPGAWREFQELSQREIWPAYEAAGAKIIGLWTTLIGEGNEVTLLTRYADLALWERTRTWEANPPAGVDAETWRRAGEAVRKRQALAETTHSRVLSPSAYRVP
jgi:lysophospholipase L1-like esterase